MKTLLSLTLLFSLLFVGCEKDPDGPFVPTPDNSTTINFEIGYLTSDKPAAEITPTKDFEDAITIYKLWIFKNSDDEAILFKEFTADEIKAMKVKIGLPKLESGEKLSFISIANHNWFKHTTSKRQILNVWDSGPLGYNGGTYEDMITKGFRKEGFTMSSQDELTATTESIYTVRTKLQKTVSKIEVFVDNDYMRNGNANYNNPDLKGFFQAHSLVITSDAYNCSLFKPNDKNPTKVTAVGGGKNTEEYKSTGIAYYCSNSDYLLRIRLTGSTKFMGNTDKPYDYYVEHQYKAEIKPNKHYIFHLTKTGSSCNQNVLDKIEEKDWVKTN